MDQRTRRTPMSRAKELLTCMLVAGVMAGCGSAVPSASPSDVAPPSRSSIVAASPPPIATSTPSAAPTTSSLQTRIAYLVERVKAVPDDGDAQLELGLALLQRIRETADPSLYPPAQTALVAARRLLPGDPEPLIGLGGLQLGRHEFAQALTTGRAAVKLARESPSAGSIIVDALIELGRYRDGFAAADALAARSPDLSSLSRLSYARELRGDISGALDAMRKASDAPSLAPENTAFALSILGHLERLSGDPGAAAAAYDRALQLVPNHAPSIAGLGRLAIGDGDLTGAATDFERAAAILPLPEYVIALGEIREASGDPGGARDQYALASAEIQLFKANGVSVDLDLALFEADHGDPARGLEYATAAYRKTPTVRAADALAWCLHRVGRDVEAKRRSDEALRLGSQDPSFLYHAGVIALALHDQATAKAQLEAALRVDPGFSAMGAKAARALLDGIQATS